MHEDRKIVRTSVSLTKKTKDIVEQLIQGKAVLSFSEGIDKIVRSWAETEKGKEIMKASKENSEFLGNIWNEE